MQVKMFFSPPLYTVKRKLMYEMNKDLPYEQQVKILLHHYDQLVVENKALKARIKEMEDEKAEYGDPKELREMLKTLPSKVKQLRELYNERDSRINWAKKKMVKYLRSKGVKMPLIMTFTKAVEMVTELPTHP